MIRLEPEFECRNRSGDPHFLEPDELTLGSFVTRGAGEHGRAGWVHFRNPARIVSAVRLDDVLPVLREAEGYAAAGGFAAGFLTYEAGRAMDAHLVTLDPDWPILAWFALYNQPPTFHPELAPALRMPELGALASEMNFDEYAHGFGRIRQALAEGESYQVNFTFRQRFAPPGNSFEFFSSRCGVQAPPFATYIEGGDWQIASLSPELLFERRGAEVAMRPMKGTAPAVENRRANKGAGDALIRDPKTIAENLMIVDMARHDLGRVAEIGSIETADLMTVERHRSVLQVTSTVRARVRGSTTDVLRSVFPPASVTGAPKVATCRLISEIEKSPRHIYCGSIGTLHRDRARFSVAIRTALLREGAAEYGVGSGVVWDSDSKSEFAECALKAEVLTTAATEWALVEAIHVDSLADDAALDLHLRRLAASAAYFKVPLDLARLKSRLASESGGGPKVRVVVRRTGEFDVSSGPSELPPGPLSARLAITPVQSGDSLLRHKTTCRDLYDLHLGQSPQYDEVLLFNERGNVTEFCRGSVAVEVGAELLTPRPEDGCLPGIGVARLAMRGEVRYGSISVDQALASPRVLFINAVAGLVPVELDRGSIPQRSLIGPPPF